MTRAALAIVAALALAGCGSSDESSPAETSGGATRAATFAHGLKLASIGCNREMPAGELARCETASRETVAELRSEWASVLPELRSDPCDESLEPIRRSAGELSASVLHVAEAVDLGDEVLADVKALDAC